MTSGNNFGISGAQSLIEEKEKRTFTRIVQHGFAEVAAQASNGEVLVAGQGKNMLAILNAGKEWVRSCYNTF